MLGLVFGQILALQFLPLDINGEVIVDFGHHKRPFVREEDGVTYLKNSDIVLQLRCIANYPTLWIYNYDDKTINKNGLLTLQWTDRKFEGRALDAGDYDYIAWVQLQYSSLKETQTLVCVAVNDFTRRDGITVTLTPELSDSTVSIKQSRGYKVENDTRISTTTKGCEFQFFFLNRRSNGLYWRCQSEDGSPLKVRFQECGSSMQCSNAYRDIKRLSKCLTIVEEETVSRNDWIELQAKSYAAGTVLCSHKNSIRALEYFFSAEHENKRKIEFSSEKIKPADLVWMDRLENEYYTNDVMNTICHFPKYGFSFEPYARLLLNNTQIKLEKSSENIDDNTWKAKIDFKLTQVGIYDVQCLGPVWNSSEWVNKTKRVNVKMPIPPKFDQVSDNFTFTEGELSKKIICSVSEGDPKPDISWENANIPIISVNGAELYFRKVVDYIAGPYACIAVNRYGQKAMKIFNIFVVPQTKEKDTKLSGEGLGTVAVIGLSSAAIIALLLIIGFVVLYKKFRKLSGQITYLSYEDVEHFREGVKKNLYTDSKDENLNNGSIECLPYNSKYEVSREKIFVDENAVLGSGQYGTVIKGTISLPAGSVAVAFKTVPRNADLSYFKALLSELKILAHIGQHPHVVGLVGAWTSNIKHREIFVGVELCKQSMVEFLRENSASYKNWFVDLDSEEEQRSKDGRYLNVQGTFSTQELLKWSQHIASGMDFLESKKVIHGDLACRNVLLTFDLQAKICDFGLARQLIDYNYIKTQSQALPWKWLAIESLCEMKFSTKSDVWAYGVTLWEIFSLGHVPYPGMNWSTEFVEKLQSGLRMTCPLFANKTIYQIMIDCWNTNPKERPAFKDIIEVLKSQSNQINQLCMV